MIMVLEFIKNNPKPGKGAATLICYEPLWKTMARKGITTYALIHKYGINPRTVSNLKHNRSITMFTLERLCSILDCQAEGIVRFLPDDPRRP